MLEARCINATETKTSCRTNRPSQTLILFSNPAEYRTGSEEAEIKCPGVTMVHLTYRGGRRYGGQDSLLRSCCPPPKQQDLGADGQASTGLPPARTSAASEQERQDPPDRCTSSFTLVFFLISPHILLLCGLESFVPDQSNLHQPYPPTPVTGSGLGQEGKGREGPGLARPSAANAALPGRFF